MPAQARRPGSLPSTRRRDGRHHQLLRYAIGKGPADTPRTTIVATACRRMAGHAWAHCGDSRCTWSAPGNWWCRGPLYLEQPRNSASSRQSDPDASTATGCSPAWAAAANRCSMLAGRCRCSRATKHHAVTPTACGQRRDADPTSPDQSKPVNISDAIPDLVEMACAGGSEAATTSPCWLDWEIARGQRARTETDAAGRRRVSASVHPGQRHRR